MTTDVDHVALSISLGQPSVCHLFPAYVSPRLYLTSQGCDTAGDGISLHRNRTFLRITRSVLVKANRSSKPLDAADPHLSYPQGSRFMKLRISCFSISNFSSRIDRHLARKALFQMGSIVVWSCQHQVIRNLVGLTFLIIALRNNSLKVMSYDRKI